MPCRLTSIARCRRKSSLDPLSPSEAGTVISEEADNLLVASPLFTDKPKSDRALQKGRLLHRMLQTLPEIPLVERADAAGRTMPSAPPVSGRRMSATG